MFSPLQFIDIVDIIWRDEFDSIQHVKGRFVSVQLYGSQGTLPLNHQPLFSQCNYEVVGCIELAT